MKGKKHHRASGGGLPMKAAGNPNVFKEAEKKGEGGSRKHGGKVHKMHGAMSRHRLDRPGRKRGGGVGSDRSPLSSAHKVSSASKDGEMRGGHAD
jgi:hypothetical protein